MIDLEDALAALVERAPEPPALEGVARRAKQRQWRRRGIALATALTVLATGVVSVVAVASSRRRAHVSVITPTTDTLRVTMLDGSQLEISGPPSLGLTALAPAFNGSLGPASDPQWGTLGHGFSVGHTAPSGLGGAVVGRYPTHDGNELVVHTTPTGVDATVRYGDWWLDASWGTSPPAQWAAFAAELNAKETADGFLVIEPTDPSWKLGWADAPDLQLGGAAYGSGAAFGFFGPGLYPAGCPTPAETSTHTAQGWPVSLGNGASWCDTNARVRVWTWDSTRVDAAVQGLRVSYTPANQAVDRITTLRGATFEITAPASVLDQLSLQASVYVDGIDKPNILNVTPNALPVDVERDGLPSGATEPSFATGDGHRLYSYFLPTECQCEVLTGTYGEWLVEIEVDGMSAADRTRVASLFAAHEAADGFLVLDPVAPMHLATGPQDIVLNGVYVSDAQEQGCSTANSIEAHTPEGFAVHISGTYEGWCDPNARVNVDVSKDPTHALIDRIHVARVG